ncbi:uncharacterized protein F5Z01DRAFT_639528 [Emericellopsis atlantica]|uniref:Uncharacterized protein n=1 Tax=Emericellopsis atlantica TaxID=2614577 RepID=A0A9P7ZFP8_9HYPO|nr:uncharacterized protein F5Z01DRAFT_639528 [Emericellopsis atlantica]KAG9251125.1 hypothetical protein F5Z01DRAFT_639528 [Emericellopsis atlantica]
MRFTSLLVAGMATLASCAPVALLDGPLSAVNAGNLPPVLQGLKDIATVGSNLADNVGTKHFSDADSHVILNASRDFVQLHQKLMNVMIGKAGLFSVVPEIGQPVTAALKDDQGAIETLAFALEDTADLVAADLRAEFASLDDSIATAVKAYEGLKLN